MRRCALLLTVALSFAVSADPVNILATSRDARINGPADVIVRPASDPRAAAVRHRVKVPGVATIDVPPGLWKFSVDLPGVWAAPAYVKSGDAHAAAAFDLWPAGTVTGKVKDLSSLVIRFNGTSDFSGEVECPVLDGRFRCALPAGRLNLRVNAPGLMPEYRWDVAIDEKRPADLGTIVLCRGASVSGLIRTPSKRNEAVTVALAPAGVEDAPLATTTANRRGWFQIAGVQPGSYLLRASAGDLESEAIPIRVRPDMEVEIREPLSLEPLRGLRVNVSPAHPPGGGSWRVRVLRAEPFLNRSEFIAEGASDPTGVWRTSKLHSGTYTLAIGPTAESDWVWKEVALEPGETVVEIEAKGLAVDGTVTLGGKPLAARLTFGGVHGSTRQELRSDEEGRFRGEVPPPRSGTRWEVTVQADKPPVERTVATEAGPSGNVAIELPLTLLSGRVVGSDGVPPKNALITINGGKDSSLAQVSAAADGTFDIFGFEPGTYAVQAESFLEQSDVVQGMVADPPNASPPLQIVLKAQRELTGRVTYNGRPVGGARVTIFPTDVAMTVTIGSTTREDGTYSVLMQPGTREGDVVVAAPGFAFYAAHRMLGPGQMEIAIRQDGGSLRMSMPAISDDAPSASYLIHNGAGISMYSLLGSWGATIASPESKQWNVMSPSMEPGEYSLCEVPRDVPTIGQRLASRRNCVSGVLAPNGQLELAARH